MLLIALMQEGEPQDTRKQSVPPAGDELQPTKHVTVKPPPATADAEGLTPNVIAYRLILIAVVVGLIGVLGALVSTIWLRPVDGFDGWYTRLSGGFAVGSVTACLASSLFAWRKDLRLLAIRWWNPLTWKLRWAERQRHEQE